MGKGDGSLSVLVRPSQAILYHHIFQTAEGVRQQQSGRSNAAPAARRSGRGSASDDLIFTALK